MASPPGPSHRSLSVSPTPCKRGRYRSTSESTTPRKSSRLSDPNFSGDDYKKLHDCYSPENDFNKPKFTDEQTDDSKIKNIDPKQIICLYDLHKLAGKTPRTAMPAYIKKADPNAPVLQVVAFDGDGSEFLQLDKNGLSKQRKERFGCLSACVEVMFNGLLKAYYKKECPKDPKWTHEEPDLDNLLESVLEEEKKWGFEGKFTYHLYKLFEGLVSGFPNGDGREAVIAMIKLCLKVVGKKMMQKDARSTKRFSARVDNVGGSAKGYKGESALVKLYHQFENQAEKKRKEEAKEVTNIKSAHRFRWLTPDVLVFNIHHEDKGYVRHFFLFAEIKSEEILDETMISQIWHQSLRGLLDYDCVYAFIINPFSTVLYKFIIKNGKLYTYFKYFNFVEDVERTRNLVGNTCNDVIGGFQQRFSAKNFNLFLRYLMRILQEFCEI